MIDITKLIRHKIILSNSADYLTSSRLGRRGNWGMMSCHVHLRAGVERERRERTT
jgi:hypothetical protein